MRISLPSSRILLCLVSLLTLPLGACTGGPQYASNPPPGSIICRYEAPTGSNVRQRVCHEVLSDEERNEEVGYVRDQLEDIRSQAPNRYPTPGPSNP